MDNITMALGLLGVEVKDKVTALEGIVTSISFDLYGCVQALVHPGLDKDRKLMDLAWFDVSRLEVIGEEPVMQQPNFSAGLVADRLLRKGPESKPVPKR